MIHQLARRALADRRLIRLPFEGGAFSRLRTVRAEPHVRPSPAAEAIAAGVWTEGGRGRFDARLLGVADASFDAGSATLACAPIRYRHYLAADALLAAPCEEPVALAVGVHALLSIGERSLCLRRLDGQLTLPGGAADFADLEAAPEAAIEQALRREIEEEIGLALPAGALEVTGLYVGGHPTHLLVLAAAEVEGFDLDAASAAARADADGAMAGVELVALAELEARIATLSLVLRAGLQSLRHRRGRGSFATIAS